MNEQLQNELEEQARLLGMSAERECDLRGKIKRLERERDEARSDLEFRRDLFKLQEQQLNEVRLERDLLKDQLAAAMMSIRLQQRREQQTNEQP